MVDDRAVPIEEAAGGPGVAATLGYQSLKDMGLSCPHILTDVPVQSPDAQGRSAQTRYQKEVAASRRVVLWATLLSIGLAVCSVLLLYRMVVI